MLKSFFVIILFTASSFAVRAQEKEVPKELLPYILEGYEVLDFTIGDLNGDKLTDYVLILKSKGEDSASFDNEEWEIARPVLLLLRQPGGGLKSVASNTEVVPCRLCGGMMGDPYQALEIRTNEFAISSYGGSSWRWAETVTFRYDKLKKNWYLQTHDITSFQAGDPDNTTTNTIIDRSETGDIAFSKYTQYYNKDSSQWKVNVPKTFFYESPVLQSKPRKAYLLKGDVVQGYKKFKNFIECTFENSKGALTTGFILRKDLVLVPVSK
ncbi:MAG: hypothetical protein ABL876_16600 [Chitinophagaceae bacterium]